MLPPEDELAYCLTNVLSWKKLAGIFQTLLSDNFANDPEYAITLYRTSKLILHP